VTESTPGPFVRIMLATLPDILEGPPTLRLPPDLIGARRGVPMVQADPERDDPQITALVSRTCAGDPDAWQALWRWLDPRLHGVVRNLRLPRISDQEDERRAVVLEVMARLRVDDFRRLRLWAEGAAQDPGLSLMPWLKVVTRRVAIDCLRAHPGYQPDRSGAGAWHDPRSLPAASLLAGPRPTVTRDGTARELLSHARQVLSPAHYQALERKLAGETPAEIAKALGLRGAPEAERIVRAAFERLRRKFRTTLAGGQP
jgi:DNA-directed RNA polymerase specialized sigma24 family protein